jgi:hypothetical protein
MLTALQIDRKHFERDVLFAQRHEGRHCVRGQEIGIDKQLHSGEILSWLTITKTFSSTRPVGWPDYTLSRQR